MASSLLHPLQALNLDLNLGADTLVYGISAIALIVTGISLRTNYDTTMYIMARIAASELVPYYCARMKDSREADAQIIEVTQTGDEVDSKKQNESEAKTSDSIIPSSRDANSVDHHEAPIPRTDGYVTEPVQCARLHSETMTTTVTVTVAPQEHIRITSHSNPQNPPHSYPISNSLATMVVGIVIMTLFWLVVCLYGEQKKTKQQLSILKNIVGQAKQPSVQDVQGLIDQALQLRNSSDLALGNSGSLILSADDYQPIVDRLRVLENTENERRDVPKPENLHNDELRDELLNNVSQTIEQHHDVPSEISILEQRIRDLETKQEEQAATIKAFKSRNCNEVNTITDLQLFKRSTGTEAGAKNTDNSLKRVKALEIKVNMLLRKGMGVAQNLSNSQDRMHADIQSVMNAQNFTNSDTDALFNHVDALRSHLDNTRSRKFSVDNVDTSFGGSSNPPGMMFFGGGN